MTNSIFRQNSDLYDVYITIDKNGTGQILYNDSDLEKQASLTNHDFRFMQTILKASNTAKQNPAEFSGNDDWLRLQFYAYLCSLFRAAQEKDEHLPEYNEDFVRGWSVTHNYRIWSRGSHEKLAEFQSQ